MWGDWPNGANMGPGYINRLARALKRNLTIPYTFTALVDRFEPYCCGVKIDGVDIDPSVDVQALVLSGPKWPGCLPKLSAFYPGYRLEGTVIIFDLDTIITGNIDHFAQAKRPLITRMAFREPGQSGGDIISFQAGDEWGALYKRLWDDYEALMEMTEGKERFVYRSDWTPQPEFWSDLFPGEYVSYKRHIRPNDNKLPENVKLVSCHGLNTNGPRPHQLLEQGVDWVKEHWV
jgi:hypothetical protein